ncbi:MAG: tetratricopeptide repeat protein [Burkholderiales bacterium]|nr:tetratricopeptide repeat protein [Burkholderiales bacterium]
MGKKAADLAGMLRKGLALHQGGRLQEARQCYEQILGVDPRHFDALQLLASLAAQSGRLQEALELFDRAVLIDRTNASVFNNRGNTLNKLGQFEAAVASYSEALRIQPDYAEALNNRGSALRELGRFDEAMASFAESLRVRPDYAGAHFNRGNTLRDLQRFDEALESYGQALRIQPGFGEAHNNRGVALQELGRFDEAEASFTEALRINPGHAEAGYNRGLLRLQLFRFQEGLADCRARWDARSFNSRRLKTSIAPCVPGALHGKVLLWAEQGLGDEVFYAGLLPQALAHDADFTLSADRRLHPVLARSFPGMRLLDRHQLAQLPVETGFDAQAPIGDLGLLLELDEPAIRASRRAYLQADPVRRAQLLDENPALAMGAVCGIAWRSANKLFGEAKSLQLRQFAPLLRMPGVRFVNLQYGAVDAEIEAVQQELGVTIDRVQGLDLFNDIEGLLALIDACSFVVTSSNVTAHLAGSIGKRSAVLVPHGGKARLWYWHDGEGDSFWYPALRLFRQGGRHDWQASVDACGGWARELAKSVTVVE